MMWVIKMRTLWDATVIRGNVLRNRLIRSATWERMTDEDGFVTPQLLKHYQNLAEGGIGMIITGYSSVREDEQPNPQMMSLAADKFIPGLQKLTQLVHHEPVEILAQLVYGGTATHYRTENRVIWGPSAVRHPRSGVKAKAMTLEDIQALREDFKMAAIRAESSGFDGVQIHAAHGYLLSQFLSPFFNHREEEYGGSLENRARLLLEVISDVRAAISSNLILSVKINASDFNKKGFTFEEAVQIARDLQQAGIDLLEISGGPPPNIPKHTESYLAEMADRIAEEITIPVAFVGMNRNPVHLKKLLRSTKVSYFSLSRPLICEPNLPLRWQRDETPSYCMSCNQCYSDDGISCVLKR